MIRVVIMAQGQQTRLPDLGRPKQLLWLEQCQETILGRTMRQLRALTAINEILVVCGRKIAMTVVEEGGEVPTVLDRDVAVAGVPWAEAMPTDREGTLRIAFETPRVDERCCVKVMALTLDEPGNSVLRGLEALAPWLGRGTHERTVVLLGDVVFSHACLRALLDGDGCDQPVTFAVTRDLSAGAGEVYGMSFARMARIELLDELDQIQHPPQPTYQSGQLRRLLWAWQRRMAYSMIHAQPRDATVRQAHDDAVRQRPNPIWCQFIDDYTTDFDTPEDLEWLNETDDEAHHDDWSRA